MGALAKNRVLLERETGAKACEHLIVDRDHTEMINFHTRNILIVCIVSFVLFTSAAEDAQAKENVFEDHWLNGARQAASNGVSQSSERDMIQMTAKPPIGWPTAVPWNPSKVLKAMKYAQKEKEKAAKLAKQNGALERKEKHAKHPRKVVKKGGKRAMKYAKKQKEKAAKLAKKMKKLKHKLKHAKRPRIVKKVVKKGGKHAKKYAKKEKEKAAKLAKKMAAIKKVMAAMSKKLSQNKKGSTAYEAALVRIRMLKWQLKHAKRVRVVKKVVKKGGRHAMKYAKKEKKKAAKLAKQIGQQRKSMAKMAKKMAKYKKGDKNYAAAMAKMKKLKWKLKHAKRVRIVKKKVVKKGGKHAKKYAKKEKKKAHKLSKELVKSQQAMA